MLSTKQVAERLSKSERTIRNWIESGILPAYRFGRNYEISEKDLDQFVEKGRVATCTITNKNYNLKGECENE